MAEINERFREVFRDSSLTQEDFAKKINRSRGEIANIIYDKTTPKDAIIKSVCEKFGIREEWLRDGLEPMKAPKTRDEEISELVGQALSGSNEFKKAVIHMICSRTDDELEVLNNALRGIYKNP